MSTPKVLQSNIDAGVDDHVFIVVRRPGRPTISLDITNEHGRACIGIRSEGQGIASILCDVKSLPPAGNVIKRFCPFCGDKLNPFSSQTHHCKP